MSSILDSVLYIDESSSLKSDDPLPIKHLVKIKVHIGMYRFKRAHL